MAQINHAGIRYSRVTSANLNVARGTGVISGPLGDFVSDFIEPPTVETGLISASTGSPTVTGVDTNFTSALIGQFLYGYDGFNNPFLIGLVSAVGSTTSLTLSANASANATSRPFGASYSLITTNESVLVWVPSNAPNPTSTYLPDYTFWRQSPSSNIQSFNNTRVSQLERYTDAGSLTAIDSTPENINFTIEPTNRFPQGANSSLYWNTAADLPTWTAALLNPNGNLGITLAATTMYRWTTQEALESILVAPGTSKSTLTAAGYPLN